MWEVDRIKTYEEFAKYINWDELLSEALHVSIMEDIQNSEPIYEVY